MTPDLEENEEKTPHELRNLRVAEISLVDAPANRRPFLLWKSVAGLTPETCRGLSDEELVRLHGLTHEMAVADEHEEAIPTQRKAEPQMRKTDEKLTGAQVVANVVGLLRKTPGAADVLMKAMEADPALAALYDEGVSSGDGGRLLIAQARAEAEVQKAARPSKHPFLVAIDNRVQKDATVQDYADAALVVAQADPALYERYCYDITHGRQR